MPIRHARARRSGARGVSKSGAPSGAPLFSFLALALLGACREQPRPAPERQAASPTPSAVSSVARALAPDASAAPSTNAPVGGPRPVSYLRVPASYDPKKPSPLVLVLHGYGSTGADHASLFTLGAVPEAERVIVVAPDGTLDASKARFWNAVPACCDFESTKVDDVAYLRGVVEELRGRYAIDPKRIYAVGHSNGGAMALRLACDAADLFAAVIDLAGPFYEHGAEACHPSQPVSARIMHGTRDAVVPFAGGAMPLRGQPRSGKSPTSSARGKADTFAALDGCSVKPTPGPDVDFDLSKPGAETNVLRFTGCKAGSSVELWTMNDVGHVPGLPAGWQSAWEFLAAHPKP